MKKIAITILLLFSPLTWAWSLDDLKTEVLVCETLPNKGLTPTFMDGFCNSLASCEKTLTCQFTAATVADGTFDKAMKVWSEPGETLQNDMSCWLLANKLISTPLNFANYFLKNCLENGATYTKSYLLGRPYWSEIKDVAPIQTRILKTSETSPDYTMPIPIHFKEASIDIDHTIRASATFGGTHSKVNLGGVIISLEAYDEIYILDGDLDPLDDTANPNKRAWLRQSAAFSKNDCAIIVQTKQPVIIQNLNIEGFSRGICVYDNSTVILSDVNITKASEAILIHTGKVLVRNSRLEASSSAVGVITDTAGAVIVNSKIFTPFISKNAVVIQDDFSQVPLFGASNAPTLRVVKISDQQGIGRLIFDKNAADFSTTDTVIVYAQKNADSIFQELQRFTGNDLGQLKDGFLILAFDISGLTDDALLTAVVIKGAVPSDKTQATHDLWTPMVNQDKAIMRSDFAVPANFSGTVAGGAHIINVCQKGETAKFQFESTDTNTQAAKEVSLKLGEDVKWLQKLAPVSSRQKLVLKKMGNEILFEAYPDDLRAYGPWFLFKGEYTWNYMPVKSDPPPKIVLSGESQEASIIISRADDPDPCSASLIMINQPLAWNAQGQVEILLDDPKGAYTMRLQKKGTPSTSTLLPTMGSIPDIGTLGLGWGFSLPASDAPAVAPPAAGTPSSTAPAGTTPDGTVPVKPAPSPIDIPYPGGKQPTGDATPGETIAKPAEVPAPPKPVHQSAVDGGGCGLIRN